MARDICLQLEFAKCGLHIGGYLIIVVLLTWLIIQRGRKTGNKHFSSQNESNQKGAPHLIQTWLSLLRLLLCDLHLWAYGALLVAAVLELVIMVATHNRHLAQPGGAAIKAPKQVVKEN